MREAFAFAPAQGPSTRWEARLGDHLDGGLDQRRRGGGEQSGGGEDERSHGKE